MNRPLVSVVLPIYNVEKFLDRCITSVVNQTYDNLEIILVDDGSPDNCPEMCDEWAERDSRIKVIHKENAGLGMARNSGIEAATGEYICFFDSDDYVDEQIIEKCINNAAQNNSDVVLFGHTNADADGRIEPVPVLANKLVYNGNSLINELLPALLTLSIVVGISAWGKMYRLNLLKEQSIYFKSEREIISEDAYFVLELLGKISCASILPENLYYYYKNENSLTSVYRADRQVKNDIYLQKSLEYCEKNGYPEVVKNAVCVCYHSYAIAAIKLILASNLPKNEKRRELKKIFKNSVLRKTLGYNVLRMEKNSLKIFWLSLKFRQYWLCRILLWYRLKVKD